MWNEIESGRWFRLDTEDGFECHVRMIDGAPVAPWNVQIISPPTFAVTKTSKLDYHKGHEGGRFATAEAAKKFCTETIGRLRREYRLR